MVAVDALMHDQNAPLAIKPVVIEPRKTSNPPRPTFFVRSAVGVG